MKTKTGNEEINLKQYLTQSELRNIKKQEVGIFANMSIIDKSIPIPLLSDNFKLKHAMCDLLETAHKEVKSNLSAMRKAGKTPLQKKAPIKGEKQIIFDTKQEKELLSELSKNRNNPVNRHFSYISLQDFYYKYRSLGEEYINKCIEYCTMDINSLPNMNEAYIAEEVQRLKKIDSIYSSKELNAQIKELKELGFIGNIPAFKRLVIIYEKQKDFDKAVDTCNKAIEYGQSVEEFEKRKQKIQNKIVK